MFDPVSKPSHYTEGRKIETIDAIEDWGLGFHLGNAVKYISRAGRKDPAKTGEDISKAIWYLERFQEQLPTGPGPVTLLDQLTSQLDEQEEAEFAAMGDLGTRNFGSDEDIPFSCDWEEGEEDLWDPSLGPVEPIDRNGDPVYHLQGKDLSKFAPNEVVSTWEEGDMILGVQKNGDVQILKHSSSLYSELDTLPSELEL